MAALSGDFDSLEANVVLELVDLPFEHKPLGNK